VLTWRSLLYLLPLLAIESVAQADVVSTTGDVMEVSPPMSFLNDEWRDDTVIRLFTEQTATLESPIDVLGVPASRVVSNDPATDTSLPTGVPLTGHYLQFGG
jgi:hypothetical protein